MRLASALRSATTEAVGAERQPVEDLAARIAATRGDWDGPVVESAVFGTGEPIAIASSIDRWVEQHLGSAIASVRGYHASVGTRTS